MQGRLACVCLPQGGHHWVKLSHKEGTSQEKVDTVSQEEEGLGVKTVSSPEQGQWWILVANY